MTVGRIATLRVMTDAQRAAAALSRVRAAHQSLLADLAVETDPTAPSLLEGWSVGHVLSHLARNADSVTRRLEAAGRGEHTLQYAGGPEGRAEEIEAGARRPYDLLVADVASSAAQLESVAAGLEPWCWSVESSSVSGLLQDAATVLARREREVVIHHSDLGRGFGVERWPAELVAELEVELLRGLPDRSTPRGIVAWLTGRGPAPELAPWS
jgi:maleylpyruvate isomerase